VFPFPLKLALKNKPVLRREIEMIITTRKVRLFTTTVICSLIGGAFAVPVLAQTAGVAKPSDEVVEVVITAQKRTERLKDVTVSASVVDNMALAKSNATDISDLNNIVPSVQLKGSFNGRVPMAMRGVSTSANEATFGLTSGVAVLIDGVPTSSDSMAANQLSDVSRVEVLKGPQSTLGGRAASAGVINIVTRRPTKTFTAEGTAIVTDDDQRRGEGKGFGQPLGLRRSYALPYAEYCNRRLHYDGRAGRPRQVADFTDRQFRHYPHGALRSDGLSGQ